MLKAEPFCSLYFVIKAVLLLKMTRTIVVKNRVNLISFMSETLLILCTIKKKKKKNTAHVVCKTGLLHRDMPASVRGDLFWPSH